MAAIPARVVGTTSCLAGRRLPTHQGLASDGGDWVSFGRFHGRDIEKDGVVATGPNMGTSEAPMRNQMKAWAEYMGNGR
jgi:hypothetical protein